MPKGKQQIIVVGGGGYGAALARTLASKLNPSIHSLTLVTPREYHLHLPASLRMIVTSKGSLEKSALIPYDNLFQTSNGVGKIKRGRVASIETSSEKSGGGNVVLAETGEKLPWDVLILASGNIWEGGIQLPDTIKETEETIKEWRAKFKEANRIVLVGGGAVGIELAGELRDEYPDKPITIVHGASSLLNDVYPQKFRNDIQQRLKRRNIKILLDTFIDELPSPGSESVTTRGGETIQADLVVPTRGGRPNTSYLSPNLSSVLTSSSHVKVLPTLQLPSHPNIFALGDITDIKEQKQVGKAGGHISLITENVLSVLAGGEAKKNYKGTFEGIFITNGKAGGAGYIGALWGLSFGDKVVSAIKGKGLFIDPVRKSLGAPPVKA